MENDEKKIAGHLKNNVVESPKAGSATKFCSKESILDHLKEAVNSINFILEGVSCDFPDSREEAEKIKITLKHAIKWIKLNSFSSLPKTDSRNATNPAVSKTAVPVVR